MWFRKKNAKPARDYYFVLEPGTESPMGIALDLEGPSSGRLLYLDSRRGTWRSSLGLRNSFDGSNNHYIFESTSWKQAVEEAHGWKEDVRSPALHSLEPGMVEAAIAQIHHINANNMPIEPLIPGSFLRRLSLGDTAVGPWRIEHPDQRLTARAALLMRFPTRDLRPFARNINVSDVACFDMDHGGISVIDYELRPGTEQQQWFPSFDEWIELCLDDEDNDDDDDAD
jgi:hypothetical protein